MIVLVLVRGYKWPIGSHVMWREPNWFWWVGLCCVVLCCVVSSCVDCVNFVVRTT